MAKQNRQYGSSNVLVRVYEKSLLTTNDFERLIQAKDREEFLQILEETKYGTYLSESTNGDFEEMLTESLIDDYEQIFAISPDPEINEYIALRYTYHNIKINFKEQITGNDLSHLYIPISPISSRALDYAIGSGESTRLPSHYLDSINEAREAYEQYQDLYSIDVIMDRRYLTHLRLLAEEIGDEKLISFTKRRIDYQNIITLVRGMNQNRTRNFLNTVLSSSGSIPKNDLIELGHAEHSDVVEYYEKTHLDKVIRQLDMEEEMISTLQLEALIDDALMLEMHEGKRVAAGPLPILAYIHARETEIKNLRIIYFAKGTDMSIDEIKERMRLNYVT